MSAIDDKYAALGGPNGFLGRPADAGAGSEEMATSDGRGRCRDFEGGSIYWTHELGAHEVHGFIRIKWAQLGGTRGFLGFPITDELPAPDGRGRYTHFEGGTIYWKEETHAHEVHGAIRDKWASMDWERGRLGYPISDEKRTSDGRGRFSDFEGGRIFWTPERGAEVQSRIDNG